MNRRRFLRPQPAVLLTPPAPAAPGDLSLLRVSRRAMATTFEIALPDATPDALAAAEAALDLIDDLEQQLTVYRDSSDVSHLNRAAAESTIEVNAGLFGLLAHAASLSADTGGAFDPAAGALIRAWAGARREERIPTPAELAAARERSGVRHLILDAARRTVKFRVTGLLLNLGGIGKGYALDRVVDLLRTRWGVGSALVQAGGSSVRAIGTPPGDPRGWLVAVRHPTDDARTVGAVYLNDQALGTSAATFQFFEVGGRRYGHLLDPRTGHPAAGTACASVVAPTAAAADALSTAFFVLGEAGARDYLRVRPDHAAVILGDAAQATPVPVNLPPGRYTPPADRVQWPERPAD